MQFDVGLEIVQVGGGERRDVTRSELLRGFSWLPDGSGLVYSSSRGSTILYPPVFNVRVVGRDGRGDRQVTFGDLSYVEPDVHQSGKLVASRIRSQSDVWRFPIGGSAAENTRDAVRITRQTGQAQTPSISPDGTEVVYLSDNGGHGNLWIARTDGSGVRQVTYERDPDVVVGVPMWSPSGDWIVFIVAPSGVSSLWAIRPDGSGLHELVARGRGGACWSGDGRWVYYTSERDGIARIAKVPAEGGTSLVVRSHASMTAVTPDGKTLYYVQQTSIRQPRFRRGPGDLQRSRRRRAIFRHGSHCQRACSCWAKLVPAIPLTRRQMAGGASHGWGHFEHLGVADVGRTDASAHRFRRSTAHDRA